MRRGAWAVAPGGFLLAALLAGCSGNNSGTMGDGGMDARACTAGARTCTTNAECDNGRPCDGVETCNAGCCQAGTRMNCTLPASCASGTCDDNSGGCVYAFNHSACPTGQRCTRDGCFAPESVSCARYR